MSEIEPKVVINIDIKVYVSYKLFEKYYFLSTTKINYMQRIYRFWRILLDFATRMNIAVVVVDIVQLTDVIRLDECDFTSQKREHETRANNHARHRGARITFPQDASYSYYVIEIDTLLA